MKYVIIVADTAEQLMTQVEQKIGNDEGWELLGQHQVVICGDVNNGFTFDWSQAVINKHLE